MSEIIALERFHPRAVKLLRKRKPFIVVACDESYYMDVYRLIRSHETIKGSWSKEDERVFRDAELRNEAEAGEHSEACDAITHGFLREKAGHKFCYQCGKRLHS